jgi:hypothetical protein
LINNLFSDKQPTEFSTRLLIPTLLRNPFIITNKVSYLTANQTPQASSTILSLLADPAPKTMPHDFLLESYTPRPYKKWQAEISSICRDTFGIFLHPKNIVPLTAPTDAPFPLSARVTASVPSGFKGGVEWYATEYLTQHLSLVNAILGLLGPEQRGVVRRDMRNCGFEGSLGKLRKASMEYYPGLHGELQRWCWMGYRDGWSVGDVAGIGVEEMPVSAKMDLDFKVEEFELPTVAI